MKGRGAAFAVGGLLLAVAAAAFAQAPAAPVVTTLTIFAGSTDGLWRSRNWGGSWEPVQAGKGAAVPAGAVRSIQPLGPRVYVGADRQVLLSDDFGETWTTLAVPGGLVMAVLPSRYPQADPTLFVGTTEGLLKSPDAGRTFGPRGLAGVPVSRLEWPGPALVAATGRGVMVSMDGGASFKGPGTGLPGDVLSLALSSFFGADPVMFAGTVSEGVFRSSNGGLTWSPAGLAGQRVGDLVWLGPLLYAATDTGVQRSEDLGRTWVPLADGLEGRPVYRLLFPLAPGSGAEIFAATDQGIWRSADGGHHWQRAGMGGRQVLSLGTFPPLPPVTQGKKKR
jgi:hypothetical protein